MGRGGGRIVNDDVCVEVNGVVFDGVAVVRAEACVEDRDGERPGKIRRKDRRTSRSTRTRTISRSGGRERGGDWSYSFFFLSIFRMWADWLVRIGSWVGHPAYIGAGRRLNAFA